jgi:hypothetical protein
MTEPTAPDADADARWDDQLIARIRETQAIDTKRALEGIKSNRTITRNHRHSVRHRAYR